MIINQHFTKIPQIDSNVDSEYFWESLALYYANDLPVFSKSISLTLDVLQHYKVNENLGSLVLNFPTVYFQFDFNGLQILVQFFVGISFMPLK